MIEVKIINPPLGVSENQSFSSLEAINQFLEKNKERLPFAEYKDGTITYNREIYETSSHIECARIIKESQKIKHVKEVNRSLWEKFVSFVKNIFV